MSRRKTEQILRTFPRDEEELPDYRTVSLAETHIESYLLRQVTSDEHFTARTAAIECGCKACVNTYNSYIDFMEGENMKGVYKEYRIQRRR